MKQDVY